MAAPVGMDFKPPDSPPEVIPELKKPVFKRVEEASKDPQENNPMAQHLIRIGVFGKPETIKRVPRTRLLKKNIDNIFEVNSHYVQDPHGTILFPHEWATRCLREPVLYQIFEKPERYKELDAHTDLQFKGESIISLLDVPGGATEEVIDRFIRAGLEDEDPIIQSAKKAIRETEKNLKEAEEKIANVPFMKIDVKKESEKKMERQAMADFFLSQKLRVVKQLEEEKLHLTKLKNAKSRIVIKYKLAHTDEQTSLSSWHLVPPDLSTANIILSKEDWQEFRVYIDLDKELPGVRKKGNITVIKGLPPDEYPSDKELNMRGVLIVRRRTGEDGWYSYANKEDKMYHGSWQDGHEHGMGTQVSMYEHFEGPFQRGVIRGRGTLNTKDGVHFEGKIGVLCKHIDNEDDKLYPLLYENEYHNGLPQSKGVIKFPDGAVYEGRFEDGRITGEGKYTLPNDEGYLEGEFKNGQLEGAGVKVDKDGMMWEGKWKRGLLHGYGRQITKDGHVLYEGTWENGEWTGKGTLSVRSIHRTRKAFLKHEQNRRKEEKQRKLDALTAGVLPRKLFKGNGCEWKYDGYFRNGKRQGLGSLTYDDGRYRYDGFWRVSKIQQRAVNTEFTKFNEDILHFCGDEMSDYVFLQELPDREIRYRNKKIVQAIQKFDETRKNKMKLEKKGRHEYRKYYYRPFKEKLDVQLEIKKKETIAEKKRMKALAKAERLRRAQAEKDRQALLRKQMLGL